MSKNTKAQLTGVLGGVALAVSSVVATNAVAEDGPMVYGLFDISIQSYDYDAPGTGSDTDYWQLKSTTSRIGIKGSETISSALDVIYQYEIGVDIEDDGAGGASSGNAFMDARDQFVGLAGGFGTVRAGRMELPLKHAQGGVDLFPDHGPGHIDFVLDDVGEARLPNSLYYTSPTMGEGIVASLALVQGESTDLDGDGSVEDSIGDAYSASVTYSSDMLFLGFGIESDIGDKAGTAHDTWRLAAQYMMDAMKFGAIYQMSEGSATGSTERTGFVLSALYAVGDVDFRLQFGDSEEESSTGTTVEERSSMAFGVSKHYSDMTTGYLEYVQGTVEVGTAEVEETILSAGLVKVF